ncbi:MAG: NAD(P)/FAD-dependent oxidoreductase [Aquificaceae bacterium]|nr:MAG: NAD(P)/FAD-dependent oxidoreductase [Aquificaceae bacterium]
MKYFAIIVGGGPAGLSAASTLASAKGHLPFMEDKKILVIDEGNSDLNKALLKNFPAVDTGVTGTEVLNAMRKRVEALDNVDFAKGKVVEISGQDGDFKVKTEDGRVFEGEKIILATGFHKFEIKGLDAEVLPHAKAPRPGKVMLKVDEKKRVAPGVYAAGLIAGEQTMVAIAMGSGTEVALNLLSDIAGKTVIIHDVVKKS